MYDACFTCVSVTPVAGITCSYNYVETCTTAACCVHRMMLSPWLLTSCSVGAISHVCLVAMNLGECSAQLNVVSMRLGSPHVLHPFQSFVLFTYFRRGGMGCKGIVCRVDHVVVTSCHPLTDTLWQTNCSQSAPAYKHTSINKPVRCPSTLVMRRVKHVPPTVFENN